MFKLDINAHLYICIKNLHTVMHIDKHTYILWAYK